MQVRKPKQKQKQERRSAAGPLVRLASSGSTGTQERRRQKQKMQRPKCLNSEQKIDEESIENRQKSLPNRPKTDNLSIN